MVGPRAKVMNSAGAHFLARPRLACDKHGRLGLGDERNPPNCGQEYLALTDELAQPDLLFQNLHPRLTPPGMLEQTPDARQNLYGLERRRDEIVNIVLAECQ